MNIGIIGSGNMGCSLGAAWAQSGHNVCFSYSRDPHKLEATVAAAGASAILCTPAEAARFGDVVLLAVHWPQVAGVASEIAPFVGARIVLTCVVPWNEQQNGLVLGTTTSAAEEIARLLPDVYVVETLPLLADTIPSPSRQLGSNAPTVFCCGDAAGAKATVAGLIEALGLEVVDAGSLRSARYLEPMAALLVYLSLDLGEGTEIAFKMLRR